MKAGKITRAFVVQCTSCPAHSIYESASIREAKNWFVAHGWVRRPELFYCPKCGTERFSAGHKSRIRLVDRIAIIDGKDVRYWQWCDDQHTAYSPRFESRAQAEQYPVLAGFNWRKWEE